MCVFIIVLKKISNNLHSKGSFGKFFTNKSKIFIDCLKQRIKTKTLKNVASSNGEFSINWNSFSMEKCP